MTGTELKKSTQEREAYFLDYVSKVRKFIKTPLMLTGGFRTVSTMEEAIQKGELDVIGLARPFTLYPDLPNRIFEGGIKTLAMPKPKTGLKIIDNSSFVNIKWFEIQIKRLSDNKEPNPNLKGYSVIWYNLVETMKVLKIGR